MTCEGTSSSEVDGSREYLRLRLHRPEWRLVLRHPPVGDLLFRSEACAVIWHLWICFVTPGLNVRSTIRQEPLPQHGGGLQVLQNGQAWLSDVPTRLCPPWDVSPTSALVIASCHLITPEIYWEKSSDFDSPKIESEVFTQFIRPWEAASFCILFTLCKLSWHSSFTFLSA